MPDPDELQPAGKDPAGGAREGEGGGAPAAEHPEESHLGDGGDPAEGRAPTGAPVGG